MNDTISLDFGPDIAPGAQTSEMPPSSASGVRDVPRSEPKRQGRPRVYATDEERKEAKRRRDRERKRERRAEKQGATDGGGAFAKELEDLKAGYKEAQASPSVDPPPPEASVEKPYISGYVLLMVSDLLFPMLVGRLFRRDTSALRLTQNERDKLEPIADRAAMDMLGHLTPTQLFLSSAFAVYAAKAQALPKLPPKERKAKT